MWAHEKKKKEGSLAHGNDTREIKIGTVWLEQELKQDTRHVTENGTTVTISL